ncbi:hypothetical protein WJX73_006749 [Symbiochloris irregularis]|uniref:Uncharacterized protein n=1 Tax=Symbiochloris irregularis TaxID=706552 RepID=A0AAW1PFE6_9CHLO
MSVSSLSQMKPSGEYRAILEQISRERLHFDLEQQLQDALWTARAPYSFWRLRGYQDLAAVFCKGTASTEAASAFQHVVSLHWAAVLQVTIETLTPDAKYADANVSPAWDGKDVSEAEQTEAMKVLQALCIIHRASKDAAGKAGIVEVLVNRLRRCSTAAATNACLDGLLALMLDNDPNQARFVQLQGIEKMCLLLREDNVPPTVRKRAAEYLNLLLTQVLPEGPPVDLKRRAQRSMQAQLGLPAAQVLLENVDWGTETGELDVEHIEFQLQDLSAATISRLSQTA